MATSALPLAPQTPSIFPQLSPSASVSQTIGTTTLEIQYHRPAVRGRQIFGALVPYGQVWRTGANDATTIHFSDPVQVNGQKVAAGTYALFSIPFQDHWTVIMNKRAHQQGAWEYDPREDVLRLDVKPKAVPHTEWLTYEIYPASSATAYVDLYWEKLRVSLLFEVDVDEIVTVKMRKTMRERPSDWKLMSDAAQYCVDQEIHMGEALGWIERSIKLSEQPTNLSVKARLLYLQGDKAQAVKLMERAIAMARGRKQSMAVTGPLELMLQQWKK